MKCPCGGALLVRRTGALKVMRDRELGQVTRVRECTRCRERLHTTELDAVELGRLRALAFRGEMQRLRKVA